MLPGLPPRHDRQIQRRFADLPGHPDLPGLAGVKNATGWAAKTLVLVVALAIVALPRAAWAWVEVHVAGDETRLTVEPSGSTRVQHKVTLKINGGPLRAFDVRGVDADAAPEADAYVVPLRDAQRNSLASASPVALEMLPRERPREDGSAPPPVLRVRFDGKGLGRGVYVLFFRYRTDLAQQGALREDGVLTRLSWSGPVWDDGLDTLRLIFQLPAAPTEPRVDEGATTHDDEPGVVPPTTLSTVRRGREFDELELVRPYAPKGEAVRWSVLADTRAFRPAMPVAEAAPTLPQRALDAATTWTPDRQRSLYVVAAVALFALFTALTARKVREVEQACEGAEVKPRPLIPMPILLRAPLAGAALVAGVGLEMTLKSGTLGAALVALATALIAHRTPKLRTGGASGSGATLRGPGRWLPVAEAEAFRSPPRPRGGWLDVSTRAGKGLFAVMVLALAVGVGAVYQHSPYHAQLLAMNVVVLLAIFCTGRLSELPPDPAASPIPLLRDISRRIKRSLKGTEARVVGRIRVPEGTPDADEIRLGLAPRAALPGFVGIEVGVVYAPGAGGAVALPEVLLRVTVGSPCEQAVEKLAASGRSVRGRRPDERVLAFTPRLPTARMTAAIAAALARSVVAREVASKETKPAKRSRKASAETTQGAPVRDAKKAVPVAA
ncbi:hypothetical protein [Chondromyces crocatus]|uniref:DUF2207 domain-containing protein n=1 Tax=Chondromyces crocatus TaxID=52 RepID=A0A0K1EPR6_CHOCO|nr:hypothetical protein [Chondromyces crocatus]AKT42637.1 uncharacterized protein CMC5_068640 [Chondromyces crocatus]